MGLKQLKLAMYAIVEDPRASRIERIEAAKVIAAIAGVLLPDTSEEFLSTRAAINLRQAKESIVQKMVARKERKRLENRRGYLKRKLKPQSEQPSTTQEKTAIAQSA
jgi:hypothetical protein